MARCAAYELGGNDVPLLNEDVLLTLTSYTLQDTDASRGRVRCLRLREPAAFLRRVA